MARSRQPRPEGPPGLGGIPMPFEIENAALERGNDGNVALERRNDENPTPERENLPSAGTNRQHDPGIEGLMAIPQMMAEQSQRLETLWSEFLDQNAVVEQNAAQLRTLEQQVAQGMSLLEQCKNAIITLEQRQNALAQQQLQSNLRVTAAQLAIQGKAAHDGTDKLVEQAERWHSFLLRDLAVKITPPSPPEEVNIPDGLEPTQH